jgi:hypothetical protein
MVGEQAAERQRWRIADPLRAVERMAHAALRIGTGDGQEPVAGQREVAQALARQVFDNA